MNCQERVQCIHEPFGDAFYYGPERLSERYENDPKGRRESGFEKSTYRTIFENIDSQNSKVRYPPLSCPSSSLCRFSLLHIPTLRVKRSRNILVFQAISNTIPVAFCALLCLKGMRPCTIHRSERDRGSTCVLSKTR